MTPPRIFSGVQPTGSLHLGNYLGAIAQWKKLQYTHECLFCVVDLHAITVPYDVCKLQQSVMETTAAYLACGIDPARATIFVQSAVPYHTELAWILGCMTPMGWLNRMTQFKEKAGKDKEKAGLGLYSYPVLMAADILLYRTTHVPVGEDQKQHLELARDIAGAAHRFWEREDVFAIPEPMISGPATRIMSLRDGRAKMSKSDPSDQSRIHLSDDADMIAKKIQKAKSDMHDGITYDIDLRPEAANMLSIMAAIQQRSVEDVQNEYEHLGFAAFKKVLADALIAHMAPITAAYHDWLSQPERVRQILTEGQTKAHSIAATQMQRVRELSGLWH